MERVSDEWITETLEMLRTNPLASADVRLLIPALEELLNRRHTDTEKLRWWNGIN